MEGDIKVNVIVPAYNEESVILACLSSLEGQSYVGPRRIVVSANGCRDNTVAVAKEGCLKLEKAGWDVILIDHEQPSKTKAINRAEDLIGQGIRVYLDADIVCSKDLIAQLVDALDCPSPRYASGSMRITTGTSLISRLYARVWQKLPFHQTGVPGAGLFAVNELGRKRWSSFPEIIADDYFARLQFSPEERYRTSAFYLWPLPDGLKNLVRVRIRQEYGNLEIARKFPVLLSNEDPRNQNDLLALLGIIFSSPIGFAVYAFVRVTAMLFRYRHSGSWARENR